MDSFYPALALTAAAFVVFGVMSVPLRRGVLTAPMLCTLAGIATGWALGPKHAIALDNPVIAAIGEVALAIVLFTDASGANRRRVRRDWGLPARLLAIGLPLTILAGTVAGLWLFPALPWVWSAVIAVVLAPTDAALGIAVLLNDAVPQRIRDALNVESGLNDGIALPVLLALLEVARTPSSALGDAGWMLRALAEIGAGTAIGAAIGVGGGRLVDAAWRRGWMDETFARLVTPGLAMLTYAFAQFADQNGFVAAYVAGLMLAVRSPGLRERLHEFGEADGMQFALFVFLLFGMVMVPAAWPAWDGAMLVYALASLTVVRMLPAGISLAGTRLGTPAVLFVGWFGPRGIASVLYVAVLLQAFGVTRLPVVFPVVVLTVLLSVLLHGVTAAPLAAAYGRLAAREHPSTAAGLRVRKTP